MELTETGTIRIHGARCMRTGDDMWSVTLGETFIGTAHDLAEASAMIEAHKMRVRERLAAVEAKAAARYTEESMRRGEGAGIDPNH